MNTFRALILATTALVLGACSSSSNNDPNDLGDTPPDTAVIQILHAVADAPTVDVLIDGEPRLTDVDYKDSSTIIVLLAGTYSVEVLANLPDGSQLSVIGPVDVDLVANTLTTVAAVGSVAEGIAPVLLNQDRSAVPADSARVAVIHAVPGPGGTLPVSVYVTDPAVEDLTGVAPIGTFDFGETLGPIDVTAGTYRIRVVAEVPGNVIEEPVYDSGPVDLADGANLRLVAVPNVSGGPAALTLMAVSAAGATDIHDQDTPAWLRVGHLSETAPPVDVILDTVTPDPESGDPVPDGNEFTYLDDVAFPAIAPDEGFDAVDPDAYAARIETADNGAIILPEGEDPIVLDLARGSVTQVFAVTTDDPEATAPIELLVATDVPRPTATGARVRVIHAASAEVAAEVDVYVLPAGTGITEGAVNEGIDPTIPGFAYKDNTGYIDIPGGDYDICVAVVDTSDCAILEATVEIPVGIVATAVAIGETELGLALLQDYPLEQPIL